MTPNELRALASLPPLTQPALWFIL
jgi:hypothetical protein